MKRQRTSRWRTHEEHGFSARLAQVPLASSVDVLDVTLGAHEIVVKVHGWFEVRAPVKSQVHRSIPSHVPRAAPAVAEAHDLHDAHRPLQLALI